jgi:hypothetical protein
MPNRDHEEAIAIVRDYLAEEFEIPASDISTAGFPYRGARPDLYFPNRKINKWVVIEVGATKAETICKYLQNRRIGEIRWYTRLRKDGVKLVGIWHTDQTPLGTIDRKCCNISQLKRQIERDLDNLNRGLKSQGLSMESYACCGGCGSMVQIKDLHSIKHYGREYAVCGGCETRGEFRTMWEHQQRPTWNSQPLNA